MTDRSALPLGKRPPVDKPRARFATFLTAHGRAAAAATPVALPSADLAPALSWPMDLNDRWGDCVVAALDHYRQAVGALLGVPYANLGPHAILDEYRTQNPGFDPAGTASTNGPGSDHDGGMIVQDYLSHLVKTGDPADPLRVVGFAAVDPHDTYEVRAATWLGLGCVTGEVLQQAQQTQAVWDLAPAGTAGAREWGGHCTVTVGWNGTDAEQLVTWGELQPATVRWRQGTMDEAWFVITAAHLAMPGFRAGFDLAGFARTYTDLTGRPFPVEVPPAPAPTPPGPQPSAGAPFRLSDAVAARVARTASGKRPAVTSEAWLEAHLRSYYGMPPA